MANMTTRQRYGPHLVAELLRGRRTVSQASLRTDTEPDHGKVVEAVESARWAPNHHLTEPWRFYLLDPARVARLGELWAEVLARHGAKQAKVDAKREQWGSSKGIIILTCTNQPGADEVTRKEDYAACCCAAQNLMLHLWSEGLGCKWSTGAVWEHEDFWPLLGLRQPSEHTGMVGIFFYGVPERIPEKRRMKALDEVLVNFRA